MDTDFVPFGEGGLRRILDGVVAEGDAAEGHHLEVKSAVDLTEPLGQAKVAKFVLGAANRLPGVAASRFRGYAVMVLGAEKGATPGLPAGIEVLYLRGVLGKYLGVDGPTFDLARLPVRAGREVLFVLVSPPEQGQSPFVCHKAFQPAKSEERKHALADGQVYVREDGATRPAKAGEMLALFRRGRQVGDEVDVQVEVCGRVYRVHDQDRPMESWLFREERRFKAQQNVRRQEFEGLRSQYRSSLIRGERALSPEQIEARLVEWRQEVREVWPERLDELLGAGLLGVGLRVVNQAESYLGLPRMQVTFHGCRGVAWSDPEGADVDEAFPPVMEDSAAAAISTLAPYVGPLRWPSAPVVNPVSWANTRAGLVVSVELDSLRPQTPWESDLDDVVVLAGPGDLEDRVRVTWALTAQDRGRRFTGEAPSPLALPVSVEQVMERIRTAGE